jgi:anti-anti-sigma factor
VTLGMPVVQWEKGTWGSLLAGGSRKEGGLEYRIVPGDEGRAVVYCVGRMTLPTQAGFARIADDMRAAGNRDWHFDLTDVEFIDSAGMWMLLMVRSVAKELGGQLSISGASGQVAKALDLASFEDVIRTEA